MYPCITVDLSNAFKEIRILPIGDVHYGSMQFNEKLFLNTINQIKNNDNYYCILLGDLIECVTKDSVGNLYEQTKTPHQQMDYIVDKLNPIKDKILAITSGNHENRIYKSTSIDVSKIIADKLGLEDRYIKDSFVLFLRFGKINYIKNKPQVFSLFITHGVGGGTKKAGKLNKVLGLKDNVVGCDVYVMGHVHDYINTYTDVFLPDSRNKKIISKTSCFLTQGAFLDFGGYGYEKNFNPVSQRFGVIIMGYDTNDEKYVMVMG